MTRFVKSTLLLAEFASMSTPKCDEPGEPSVPLVVEWELVSSKAIEPVGHLGEHLQVKSMVLVSGGSEKPIETELIFDSHQVHEVPSLGSAEDCQHFVHRQFFGSEELETRTLDNGEETCVTPQVDFRSAVLAHHEESDESGAVQNPFDGEAVLYEGSFCRRSEAVHCVGSEAEEVEVPCTPVNGAMHDESGATGKSEVFGFGKTGDEPSYSLLQRAQQSESTPRWRSIHSFQGFRTAGGSTRSSKSLTSSEPSM